MMILESMDASGGFLADGALELLRGIWAFAVQVTGELGGVRNVGLLFGAGVIMGLLFVMYEIWTIDR